LNPLSIQVAIWPQYSNISQYICNTAYLISSGPSAGMQLGIQTPVSTARYRDRDDQDKIACNSGLGLGRVAHG
jgi:hypothetical protein